MTPPLLRKLLLRAAGERLRQSLRTFAQTSSIYDLRAARSEPGKSRVAVLAPHMDDEVLGCGGTLARHAEAGSDITVIFLTDGCLAGRRDQQPEEIVSVRKAEARCAAQVLGIRTLTFLDAEDGRLRFDRLVASRVREALERDRPEILYLPSFLEGHADHRAASGVLLEATRGSGLSFECRAYEVWTPLFPNCLVSIDATVQLKQQALRCYRSQLAVVDYAHSGLGLNAFRAMGLGSDGGRFAEAFHAQPLADYRRLCEAVGLF
jgi:LmbE family N-acetylglucosaminyl deacetylase